MKSIEYYEDLYDIDKNCIYYRHKLRIEEDFLPTINLSIVDDLTEGRSILRIEPNNFFTDKNTFNIFWKARGGDELGQLNYTRGGSISDYLFAAEITKFLSLDFDLIYCGIKLFNKQKADAFITTFTDYHKILSGEICLNPIKK